MFVSSSYQIPVEAKVLVPSSNHSRNPRTLIQSRPESSYPNPGRAPSSSTRLRSWSKCCSPNAHGCCKALPHTAEHEMLEMRSLKLVFAMVYEADGKQIFVSFSYHRPVDAQFLVTSSNHIPNPRTLIESRPESSYPNPEPNLWHPITDTAKILVPYSRLKRQQSSRCPHH